jgi:hypothetical protein
MESVDTPEQGSLIELGRPSLDPDLHLQRRAIFTCLLQAIPWAGYVSVVILELIMHVALNFENLDRDVFTIICYSFLGILIVLAIIGAVMGCYNLSSGLTALLILVFYIVFGAACVALVALYLEEANYGYAITIGFPLAGLTFTHFICAILYSSSPFSIPFSVIVCIVVCASPTVVLLLDAMASDNHPYLIFECVLTSGVHGLFALSWCACLKHSLPVR